MDPSASDALQRRIWARHPTRPCRFFFSAERGVLHLEAASPKGQARFARYRKKAGPGDVGAFLVTADGTVVFAAPRTRKALLEELARFVRANVDAMPALANLIDAGIARVPVDLGDNDALTALDADALDIKRDAGLWAGLLEPEPATVARALRGRQAGDRFWFRLDRADPDLPLLVQRIDGDPNRDRIDHLVRTHRGDGPDRAVTGIATVAEDGRIQLVARRLEAEDLPALAAWVKRWARVHPELEGLAHCRLVLATGGRVAKTFQDPILWGGLKVPLVPGTEAWSAQELIELEGDRWFWLDARERRERLVLAPAGLDRPDRWQGRLVARFAGSAALAVTGSMRRLPSRRLVLTVTEITEEAVAALAVLSHREGFTDLVDARMLTLSGGRPIAARSLSEVG